jgi:ABC-type multidrug transport system fused ATPase/permease subunit
MSTGPHERRGSGDEVPGVIFDEVSKFYGEVLGVNRVTLNIPPGITSLVGPNGAGKTTLMNLMTGLIFPDHGRILMRGISPREPSTTPLRAGQPGSLLLRPVCFSSDTGDRKRRNGHGRRSNV